VVVVGASVEVVGGVGVGTLGTGGGDGGNGSWAGYRAGAGAEAGYVREEEQGAGSKHRFAQLFLLNNKM